jgi:hypothetical protein
VGHVDENLVEGRSKDDRLVLGRHISSLEALDAVVAEVSEEVLILERFVERVHSVRAAL